MNAFSTLVGKARRTASRLSIVMMLALLFGSAVARADVVLDWNAIAVNTAIANGQNGEGGHTITLSNPAVPTIIIAVHHVQADYR
jgi:hypothetical protein